MGKILSTKNLRLYYGKSEALHGISLKFLDGEITALIGPSGCGKSTYLRCLNRMNDLLDNVTITGTIKLQGKDLYSPKISKSEIRKKIGMVFQQPNPFPFSIYDNVAYGPRISGIKNKSQLDEIVETSLKKAAIWDEVKDDLKKNAMALSGGQQQRVCIARTLAVNPDVILLDEPTSALDPISSVKVESTLMDIKKDYNIILVTHNMQQASRISDKTAFMLNGRLIEFDKTEKMFLNPENKITSDYLNGRFG
ncbi:phosphate ABC transporter ATP-binding protein PstB [Apilactobacillus ozensis]|uniref:Phosphate ABC superfamily ATP binding cassette transporter, ABC protein n=1 Tax=Apilactobacillus ozensis DSM 23829 = JCM 17196 TaxID=1423781 RepID=A0A0R2ANP9_9LACO|nr:phosphate ABC transporter ATP-binding protein PstB [Apilactobacillus ozensis]KRM68325.1 phosphate ABC superfamily ATP binding cassette transporter, ABC protein [Apilactobacillus ozensis DSM 23829 = JCM 17196]MCK8607485.1 phosphate ABC transporter ATP-binding protein PstB [Apilactobacillus ozensis]